MTPLRAYEMRELARVVAADPLAHPDLRDMIHALEELAEHGEQWQCATCGRWWCGPPSHNLCGWPNGNGVCASSPKVPTRDPKQVWAALKDAMRGDRP